MTTTKDFKDTSIFDGFKQFIVGDCEYRFESRGLGFFNAYELIDGTFVFQKTIHLARGQKNPTCRRLYDSLVKE